MIYDFTFWRHLTHPSTYVFLLQKQVDDGIYIRGYKKWLVTIFLLTIFYFIARNVWGVNTENLTMIFVAGTDERYIVARLLSLAGTLLFAIAYWVFHYYLFSYILSGLFDIPFKWAQKIQLYVIFFIILEKVVTFIIFILVGFHTPFTMFSIAPMTAYIYYHEFLLFFLNQLTVATVVTIIIQATFLKNMTEANKGIIIKLILLHISFALIVAVISILPLKDWIARGFLA